MSTAPNDHSPRPPGGGWLGTPFLRFERERGWLRRPDARPPDGRQRDDSRDVLRDPL